MTTKLLEVNRKTHWQRVQVKGLFKRARTIIVSFEAHLSGLASDSDLAKSLNHRKECEDIYDELCRLEKQASGLLERMYEAYRETNPPKRDRRRKKRVS